MGQGVRKFHLVQIGRPFLFRDGFAEMVVFGHVVLEGKDAVTEDTATGTDDDLVRKVFGIKEFAAIRGISAIVPVVPDVIRNGRKVRRGIHRQQRLGRHGLRRI